MPFNLADHLEWPTPALRLVMKINNPNLNPAFGRPSHRTVKVRINHPVEDIIGTETDKIGYQILLTKLVKLGIGKGGVTSKPEQMKPGPIASHNGLDKIYCTIC
jgi:hypothetical protein